MTVHRMRRRATIAIGCRGHGGFRHPPRADGAHLRRLTNKLDGHRLRAGTRLAITISEEGHRPERIQILIRFGALPRVHVG
jgi:hypothetical protein